MLTSSQVSVNLTSRRFGTVNKLAFKTVFCPILAKRLNQIQFKFILSVSMSMNNTTRPLIYNIEWKVLYKQYRFNSNYVIGSRWRTMHVHPLTHTHTLGHTHRTGCHNNSENKGCTKAMLIASMSCGKTLRLFFFSFFNKREGGLRGSHQAHRAASKSKGTATHSQAMNMAHSHQGWKMRQM